MPREKAKEKGRLPSDEPLDKERLKEIVDCLPFPVAIYSEDGEFLTINPAWLSLSGYAQDQLPDIDAWIRSAGQKHLIAGRQLILDNFKLEAMTHKGAFPVITASGEERIWDFYSGPFGRDRQGRKLAVSTAVDVTDRTKAEGALREREEELALLNQRKDEFLATLAHELRNPLAAICAGLEVIKLAENNPLLRDEAYESVERQSRQLVILVDDLLEVSRIANGKLKLGKVKVSLGAIVRNAVDATRAQIKTAGHLLSVDLPEQEVVLDVDPHRMTQVLTNLLDNATKYTPENGHIRLTARIAGDQAVLHVHDTGIGIPLEQQHRVFEMFTQLSRTQERGYGGLGLGLNLAKSLVELHGGTIEVSSEGPGRGSTFTVRLPLDPSQRGGEEHFRQEWNEAIDCRARILVVDDNKDAAHMLAAITSMLGCEVRTAHTGKEAVEVAAQFLPELILMDLGMPEMDGIEATRQIRGKDWGRQIKIVALTGWGQEEDRRKTNEAGFEGHLVKPVHPAVLRELLLSLKSVEAKA